MRLTKIKLAGFKSFVDPTIFHIPSNLVGIVGPNGCGKSNLIDAVRWVMGESSARSLRGESMADVIFNGSASRKPVGQAAIELVFDNSQGKLGGPWVRYAEIAIKRVVTRDGQSSYFLNSVRCRRKDIVDIFLGTGLGPRSYAIIEQGMISRLIDARAEDLRIFLEEAAGISKYKERRRETEGRILQTRDNLERLTDLRAELAKQLQHLQRQARVAEQYQRYRTEEHRLKAELLVLRWQNLDGESKALEKSIGEQETVLEAKIAEQRRLEVQLESGREQRLVLTTALNESQAHYYALGSEVTRLEQSLAYQRELEQRQQEELHQTEQALGQLSEQLRFERERIQAGEVSLAEAEATLELAKTRELEAHEQMTQAETALHGWQEVWEEFSGRASEPQSRVEIERLRIMHLEKQLQHQRSRAERLRLERDNLALEGLEQELEELRSAEQASELVLTACHAELTEVSNRVSELGVGRERLSAEKDSLRERIQSGWGRLTSLRTLQEAALGRREEGVNAWLKEHGLGEAPRLVEQLAVEKGWERAVETVLGGYLEAVCIQDLRDPAAFLNELTEGHLTLLAATSVAEGKTERTLLDKVQSSWPLSDLLARVRVVDDLGEALSQHGELAQQESLITADGTWLGRNWLRVARGDANASGLLVREREIRTLEATLERDAGLLEELSASLGANQAQLDELECRRCELQETSTWHHREQVRLQAQLIALADRLEEVKTRRARVDEELEEIQRQTETDQRELQAASRRLEEALRATDCLTEERQTLLLQRDNWRNILDERRALAAGLRRASQEQALMAQSLRIKLAAALQGLERLEEQIEKSQSRRQQLLEASAASPEPVGERLQAMLGRRVQAEEELASARGALESHERGQQDLEQARTLCQYQLEKMREALEAQRLARKEVDVQRQTLLEQLRALGAEVAAVQANLPPDLDEAAWQARLQQLAERIQRLGAVNLAAIEEFAQLSERRGYLDAQDTDLREALTTLENAIQRIDRETRSRFQSTFERVNENLQRLFPRLFGGGRAYLQLLGEDSLDGGVAIMARPPGKRIGTIHLLSGGEKALTAVALLFALFQLNPAPFCMLDEVDAPLDEANIARFGELLREMSEQIQFVFITHNKGTMEIARHLSGVTMHEPGVSRLVAVDVDEAIRLAATG